MTNKNNTVLYTGVTSDLRERVLQHFNKKHPHSFSARYSLCKLVYFECLETMIVGMNPEWDDLSLIPDENQGLLQPPASASQ